MSRVHTSTVNTLAESHFLGACFLDPTLVLTAEVEPDDFSDLSYRWIWGRCVELVDQGVKIDEFVLLDETETAGEGAESQLSDAVLLCYSPGGVENADIWLGQMHEARLSREIAILMDETKAKALEFGLPAADVTEHLTSSVERLSARSTRREHVTGVELINRAESQFRARVKAYKDGDPIVSGAPTGLKALDELLGGGVPIGKPSVMAARPAGGKTTWLFNFQAHLAAQGIPCLYLSNEDTDEPLGTTALAYESGVQRGLIKGGKANPMEQVEVVSAAKRALETWAPNWMGLWVHGMRMDAIIRRASALTKRHGFKVIALDYIQNVPNPKDVTNRNQGIEENLALWENMCAKFRVAGVLGCQLKRGDGVPDMQRLKDSGALEQKAKLVLALHETEELKKNDKVRIFVLKQNDGVMNTYVDVNYRRATSRFF